jgi:flagellar motor switch protein FliG
MDAEAISGLRKAAILLLVMDDEMTKEIMKDLDEDEIEAIGQEITNYDYSRSCCHKGNGGVQF